MKEKQGPGADEQEDEHGQGKKEEPAQLRAALTTKCDRIVRLGHRGSVAARVGYGDAGRGRLREAALAEEAMPRGLGGLCDLAGAGSGLVPGGMGGEARLPFCGEAAELDLELGVFVPGVVAREPCCGTEAGGGGEASGGARGWGLGGALRDSLLIDAQLDLAVPEKLKIALYIRAADGEELDGRVDLFKLRGPGPLKDALAADGR